MSWAADRDRVARQYATDFGDVFEFVLPRLIENSRDHTGDWVEGVIATQVEIMAEWGDSLVERKAGPEVNNQLRKFATAVNSARQADPEGDYLRLLQELDFWLRSDGRRRNPGTTADLLAAGMFVGLVNQVWIPRGNGVISSRTPHTA
jgi:triphosphoribosyl-dephospho-CoA synthase